MSKNPRLFLVSLVKWIYSHQHLFGTYVARHDISDCMSTWTRSTLKGIVKDRQNNVVLHWLLYDSRSSNIKNKSNIIVYTKTLWLAISCLHKWELNSKSAIRPELHIWGIVLFTCFLHFSDNIINNWSVIPLLFYCKRGRDCNEM